MLVCFVLLFFSKESTLAGWHLVGHSGRTVWSVYRQTPSYLSIRHTDVVTDLGSSYYWNAPGAYLGNKVTIAPKKKHTYILLNMLFLYSIIKLKSYYFNAIQKICKVYIPIFLYLFIKATLYMNRNCLYIII